MGDDHVDRRQVKKRKRNSRAVLMARGLRILSPARATRFVFVPYVELLRSAFLREQGNRTRAFPASNGGFSPGVHLFPFRTEPLSPGAPMVLPSPVGESVAANFIRKPLAYVLLPALSKGLLRLQRFITHYYTKSPVIISMPQFRAHTIPSEHQFTLLSDHFAV